MTNIENMTNMDIIRHWMRDVGSEMNARIAFRAIVDEDDGSMIAAACDRIAEKLLGPDYFTEDEGMTYYSADRKWMVDCCQYWPTLTQV